MKRLPDRVPSKEATSTTRPDDDPAPGPIIGRPPQVTSTLSGDGPDDDDLGTVHLTTQSGPRLGIHEILIHNVSRRRHDNHNALYWRSLTSAQRTSFPLGCAAGRHGRRVGQGLRPAQTVPYQSRTTSDSGAGQYLRATNVDNTLVPSPPGRALTAASHTSPCASMSSTSNGATFSPPWMIVPSVRSSTTSMPRGRTCPDPLWAPATSSTAVPIPTFSPEICGPQAYSSPGSMVPSTVPTSHSSEPELKQAT